MTWKEVTNLTHKKVQLKREVQELWENKKRPSYLKSQILQLNRDHNNQTNNGKDYSRAGNTDIFLEQGNSCYGLNPETQYWTQEPI